MPRTEAIFRWVFGAAPDCGYSLAFEATEDIGLSPEALKARAEKETREPRRSPQPRRRAS